MVLLDIIRRGGVVCHISSTFFPINILCVLSLRRRPYWQAKNIYNMIYKQKHLFHSFMTSVVNVAKDVKLLCPLSLCTYHLCFVPRPKIESPRGATCRIEAGHLTLGLVILHTAFDLTEVFKRFETKTSKQTASTSHSFYSEGTVIPNRPFWRVRRHLWQQLPSKMVFPNPTDIGATDT